MAAPNAKIGDSVTILAHKAVGLRAAWDINGIVCESVRFRTNVRAYPGFQ